MPDLLLLGHGGSKIHCVLCHYSDNISDRYYVALYRKLGDPELKHSARQSMFLNLLFKSMKKDVCERRVSAFIKRLLQVCSYQPPPFICAALILLSEVSVLIMGDVGTQEMLK